MSCFLQLLFPGGTVFAAHCIHAPCGREYRPVAGTPAQVPGNCVADLRIVRIIDRLIQSEQGHDEPRRAEATLGTVAFHHGLLDRMQAPAVQSFQAFYREQRLAVDGRQELDAGIGCPLSQLIVDQVG